LTQLTAEQWQRLSAYLDRAEELEGQEREQWICELEREDAEMGLELRRLLEAHEANSAAAFLERSPLDRAGGVAPQKEIGDDGSQMIGRQFGSYRVLSLLGHGGMGSVWLAERVDGLFTRRVALKLVHPALVSQLMIERFGREREILASLSHPNIPRLIDAGFGLDGQPYFALEYVEGKRITDYCDELRLSIGDRLELFRQVLTAVQYAHAHLVIHRDLKPSNILVTRDGLVHLLDFGIAKLLSEGEAKETELTRVGGRALTPDYAAPEQIAGSTITTSADVYGLGVILYELLTGERPYRVKRSTRGALEEAILQADPVAPSRAVLSNAAAEARASSSQRLSNALRGDLDTILKKALKKAPAERYQSAAEFAEDLRRYLQKEPVMARPDSALYRSGKFFARHRVGAALAAIVVTALGASTVVSVVQARRAEQQRDLALSGFGEAQDMIMLTSFLLGEALPADKPEFTTDVLLRGVNLARNADSVPLPRRAAMLEMMGVKFENDRDYAHAAQVFGEAHGLATKGSDEGIKASTACHLALINADQGHPADSAAAIDRALTAIPKDNRYADARVVCHAAKSQVDRLLGRPEIEELEAARRDLADLPVLDLGLESVVIGLLADAYADAMQIPAAIQAFDREQTLLEQQGLLQSRDAVTEFANRAVLDFKIGRPLDAAAALSRSQELNRSRGTQDVDDPIALLLKARIAAQLGDLAGSIHGYVAARELARERGDVGVENLALAEHAVALVQSGEYTDAGAAIKETEKILSTRLPAGHWLFGLVRMQSALMAEHLADGPSAQRLADESIAVFESSPKPAYQFPIALVSRAGLEQRAERFDAALADANRALQIYDRFYGREVRSASIGDAAMAAGRALRATGDQRLARQRFSDAAEHFESSLGADHARTQEARRAAAN
jgi:serine/threonine protein kinase